jgi:zinc/manganese transport system permease protein
MINAWIVTTIVAVTAGVVGFFVVMRGSTFVAHAVPQSGFAGAAGASLLGINTFFGLGAFALASAVGIGWLGRRGRRDAMTALAVVMMLGLGALFLSWTTEYAPAVFSLLFGEVLGVSSNEIIVAALLGAVSVAAVAILYRPLLLTSIIPEAGAARGMRGRRVEMCFLVVVAMASTMAVPVVGALLMFSLMVGPPAASRYLAKDPPRAIVLSVAMALATVWGSVAASYASNWPIGFFVGTIGASWYVLARAFAAWHRVVRATG